MSLPTSHLHIHHNLLYWGKGRNNDVGIARILPCILCVYLLLPKKWQLHLRPGHSTVIISKENYRLGDSANGWMQALYTREPGEDLSIISHVPKAKTKKGNYGDQ